MCRRWSRPRDRHWSRSRVRLGTGSGCRLGTGSGCRLGTGSGCRLGTGSGWDPFGFAYRCGRRWLGGATRRGRGRQECERVVVGVTSAGVADSEVDVRRGGRALAGGPHRPDRLARGHVSSGADLERRQVEIRGVVTVARPDADRHARRPGRPREAHLAAGRRAHGRSDRGGDVDPSMLPRRIRIRPVAIRSDHLTGDRPDPGGVRKSGPHDRQGSRETGGED